MAEKEYIERGALIAEIDENFHKTDPSGEEQIGFLKCRRMIREQPAADVVEVDDISDKIIRKKAEVSDYWYNDVKKYRVMQGYSDIEHDVDNFLRGYNEAIEDVLAILDGTPQKEEG